MVHADEVLLVCPPTPPPLSPLPFSVSDTVTGSLPQEPSKESHTFMADAEEAAPLAERDALDSVLGPVGDASDTLGTEPQRSD